MEHKLILGGEIYLPFARSRIKALRATGLEYASQQFEMGDASVKVRIMPGHEYIVLSGGATIAMDSGVVDIRSISFQNTDPALGFAIPLNIYAPGKLYLTDHVSQYTSIFTGGGPPKGYTHKGNSRQYAGTLEINSGGAKGYVLKDDGALAASFEPGMIEDKATGQQIPNPENGLLARKKYGARWCPPSVFTGKCRMYVQALMGSPLYGKNNKTKVKPHPYTSPDPYQIGPLNLTIPGAGDKGVVIIDTSTGVYLDKATYKHWLFVVRGNQVIVYPLKPSYAGLVAFKQLKKLLADTTDFDHLEAYILSESYPVFAERQIIDVTPELAMYGCGYGWHWAWSTATADIVQNSMYEQDMSRKAMESIHFRISFAPSQQEKDGVMKTVWAIDRTVVSGPTRWAADYQHWCIACPIFGSNFLDKILPKQTILFDCDGPFYVFYKRDELCVCTFRGSVGDATAVRLGPTLNWSDKWVLGTRPAGESLTSTGSYKSGSFKVGALFNTPMNKEQYNQTFRDDVEVTNIGAFGGSNFAVLRGVTVDIGYPINTNEPGYSLPGPQIYQTNRIETVSPDPPLTVNFNQPRQNTYQYTRSQTAKSTASQNVAAIPFFDAEAIYVYSKSETTDQIIDKSVMTAVTGNMSFVTTLDPGGDFEYFRPWQLQIGVSVVTPSSSTTTYGEAMCRLVCSAGVATAEFSARLLQQFADPLLPAVSATLATTSGVNTSAPLMIAPGILLAPVGTSAITDEFPIIVGYA